MKSDIRTSKSSTFGGVETLFESTAGRTPDATALVWGEERLSYRELDTRAGQLAAWLRTIGIGPEALVGICLERTPSLIVALLAVLKSGGAYVPLDPAYPRDRLEFILGDTQMPVVLTQRSLADLFPHGGSQILCLDTLPHSEAPTPESAERASASNLAYVIYTSGSTGQPKGVCIERRNTLALIEWARTVFDPCDLAGVLASTSICFDLSVFEIFLPLACGGKIILAANALELPSLSARDEVTLINTVPSAMAELVRSGSIPASVRTVCLAGEPLSQRLVREIYRQENIARVFDLYGPSETTTYSTFALRKAAAPATIGQAIAGTQVHLLDASEEGIPAFRRVADGEIGEIYIGGAGVARGYWQRPELTAERFVANPFGDGRLYRTGDLARTMPNGNLEFLGRIDHQVKIRGFRIELGEIESSIAQYPGLDEAVVIAREKSPGDTRLVAYFTTRRVGAPEAGGPGILPDGSGQGVPPGEVPPRAVIEELRSFLQRKLPGYMVPAVFIALEHFPRTPNGKLDRKALPAPDWTHNDRESEATPLTPTGSQLAEIWCAVLGVRGAAPHDSFLALGGHSLLALRVALRVREMFGVPISLCTIFENPTLRELAAHIDRSRESAPVPALPPIAPAPRTGPLPLSFAQERLWFLDKLEPHRAVYNVAIALRIDGPLDSELLRRCLDEIIRRHESLRTHFAECDGQPVQVIREPFAIELPVTELAASDAWRRCEEEARRPFDLTTGPLLRAALLRSCDVPVAQTLSGGEAGATALLFLNVHHIAMDDWSASILVTELRALYDAFAAGQPSPLAPLPIQYADFAAWQRHALPPELLGKQLAYWKRQLRDAPALLELPADHPRPAVQTHRGAMARIDFPNSLRRALEKLSKDEGVSFFMLLLAAFEVFLHRITGQGDIVVGSPIAGRTRAETENLIGFFVNTLALRCDLSGDPTFREILAQVRDTTLAAHANQDLPFEKLVEELNPARNLSHSPVCQVIFALQHPLTSSAALDWVETGAAKFDFTLTIIEHPDRLEALAEYSTDLFERDTVLRYLGNFRTLLEGIVADPSARGAALPLVNAHEREHLLGEWNRTETPYARESCIHELFEAHATRAPDATALVFGDRQITYRQLDEQANQLANLLRKHGVAPGAFVGVCIERSPELIAALLGILKAGAGYVPLDPSYPAERLDFMIRDVAPTPSPLIVLAAGALPSPSATRASQPLHIAAAANEPSTKPPVEVRADDLAYVIYTSGSTGQPKGVLVPHRGLCNVAEAQARAFGPAPGDRVLQFASISFDASIFEVVMALTHGAALCIGTQEELMPGPALVRFLETRAVSIVTLTPSSLAMLPRTEMPALRVITVAGEACSAALVDQWAPGRKFFNLYGPTETTIWATMATCRAGEGEPPIGHPIANTQAFVLDRHLAPVPVGVIGELCLGGDGVARGYLNRPALTAERFITTEHGRLYRTGDLVRRRADGSLEFRGRADQQVKLRGFRIELGEIESVLRQHSAVSEAAVIANDERLAAFIVAKGCRVPGAQELQAFLRKKLPEHLVPASFTLLDALPLSPSGKLDRAALPAPDLAAPANQFVAPATPTEERLARIWSAVLRAERVGVLDNFFALGGHSLLAGQLVSRVRDEFQIELPLRAVFENQTVRALAAILDRSSAPDCAPPVARAERTGPLPLSFAQERLWFLDQFEPGTALHNVAMTLRLDGALDAAVLRRCLDEIVRRHESVRTHFVECDGQPVQIIGEPMPIELPCHDVSADEAAHRCEEEARRPFDLAGGPLLRAVLFRGCGAPAATSHLLFINVHHIAMDEWSAGVLMEELATLYAAFAAAQPSPLAEPAVQYADFAIWQRDWLRGPRLEAQLAYWRERLAGAPPLLELPADRARPAVMSHRGALVTAHFPEPLAGSLRSLARAEGVSLFMLALAAFQVLVSRLTGREDIIIGSPSASRHRTEIEGLIGFFVNLLVLRCDLAGNPTFRELLARVREATLGAVAHQDLPFEKLVEELKPARNLGYTPLCQIIFAVQNLPAVENDGPLRVSLDWVPTGTAKFDLSLTLIETRDGLRAMAEFSTDLFDHTTIAALLDRFRILLEGIVANPAERIGALPLMSDAERTRILIDWNRTEPAIARECSIHELFETQARRTPDTIALVFEEKRLTYGELDAWSDRVAAYLRGRGVGPEICVGLCIERSLEMIVGLLGILKAGGAYVPVDPSFPEARRNLLLDGCSAALVLTAQEVAAVAATPSPREPRAATASQPHHLAYVLHTSGSTGGPKPVAIEHRQLVNYTLAIIDRASMTAGWSFATGSSLSADLGNTVIFPALCIGGTLHIIAEHRVADPIGFAAYFTRHAIDCLKIVPSHLAALLSGPHPESVMPRRCLILGGEAPRIEWVARLHALAPECAIFNHYGPTETTVGVLAWRVPPSLPATASGTLPLGRPLAGTRIYVLDVRGEPVPPGVAGDLHIGGLTVGRGYLGRAELTAERFIANPFVARDRLYRTGDRVRFLADGNVEFLGRMDDQIKVRGFRIEPAEIEAALATHPRVQRAAVVARESVRGELVLVAFVVAREALDAAALRDHLSTRLPDALIPTSFVFLEELPLTAAGKLDRLSLPQVIEAPERESSAAPRTELECQLADVWQRILGIAQVGVRDNFFDLGGHSLLAARVIGELHHTLGITVPMATLFLHPTIESLARALPTAPKPGARSFIQLESGAAPMKLIFIISEFGMELMSLAPLLRGVVPTFASIVPVEQSLIDAMLAGRRDGLPSLEQLAARHVEQILEHTGDGPCVLAGYCFEGVVAIEIARGLQAHGRRVEQVLLFDSSVTSRSLGWRFALRSSKIWARRNLELTLRFGPRYFWEKLRAKWWRAPQNGALPGAAAGRTDEDHAARFVHVNIVRNIYRHALRQYRPQMIANSAALFLSNDGAGCSNDPTLGARDVFSGGVEIVPVAGNHTTMLQEPHLEALAGKIRRTLGV